MNSRQMLRRFPIRRRRGQLGRAWPMMAVLGTGIVTGLGLGLLFAPRTGRALRGSVAGRLDRGSREAARALGTLGGGLAGAVVGTLARLGIATGSGDIDYDAWTRSELYDRARLLDIPGRSDMTKAELIEALRVHSR